MPLLIILFIALPIAELYVIIQVGGAIGILPTLALLIVDSVVGAALARSQGRAAWSRFQLAMAEGRVPAREVFDGAMVILGGALLLTPGFITDIFGLLLLLPPTRAVIGRLLTRSLAGRVRMVSTIGGLSGQAFGRRPAGDPSTRRNGAAPAPGYDYEGTAHEVDEPPGELPPGDEPRRG